LPIAIPNTSFSLFKERQLPDTPIYARLSFPALPPSGRIGWTVICEKTFLFSGLGSQKKNLLRIFKFFFSNPEKKNFYIIFLSPCPISAHNNSSNKASYQVFSSKHTTQIKALLFDYTLVFEDKIKKK